jgi:hypothetical protein
MRRFTPQLEEENGLEEDRGVGALDIDALKMVSGNKVVLPPGKRKAGTDAPSAQTNPQPRLNATLRADNADRAPAGLGSENYLSAEVEFFRRPSSSRNTIAANRR